MKNRHHILTVALATALTATAVDANPASDSINGLGLDLYRHFAADPGNLCLSPYSIQSAFAMAANGAAGKTLGEMRTTLHYPQDLASLNSALAALASDFEKRQGRAEESIRRVGKGEPAFDLMVANRLFGQKGYPFEPAFLKLVEDDFNAPLQFADFNRSPDAERLTINRWVEKQTRDRIKDLLPDGSVTSRTSLILVNAVYFKAAWRHKFSKSASGPATFHLEPDKSTGVPTMRATRQFGHSKEDGYTALTLPYSAGFAMLLIIPDEIDGLAAIAGKLNTGKLASLTRLPSRKVSLHLPKFKISGPTIRLKTPLEKLGMKLAFDRNLADFSPMTSDKSLPGLFISDAYHKTFIAVDEEGTEAAAATAIAMEPTAAMPKPEDPIEVRADRPFFYAIVDTNSRAALFLGRITDPR